MGTLKTLTINGVTYEVTSIVPADSVTLLESAWVGDGPAYSQVVEVIGATEHTKVDLQPTADQLAEFHHKVLAFVAENDNGVITVYSIGDKPTGDHTIQITKTEVEGTSPIRGNTVGTTMPRPNWEQTDPTKADYILNKPVVVKSINGVTPDENGIVVLNSVGDPGSPGVTFTPSVSAEGVISWTNDGGLDNPVSVNIKGPKGETGDAGKTPVKGTDYYTAADKTEMVNAVLAALPTWTGGSY
jgi:hypothetical protein